MAKYTINIDKRAIEVDSDNLKTLDIAPNGASGFHVLKNNKPFNVRLIHADYLDKTLTISVNGNTYITQIDDIYDLRVKKMGLLSALSLKEKDLFAPMPGQVVDIVVEEGHQVQEADPLLILSAMKMENVLLAQAEGTIKSIKVNKGDAVEKGQLIIEIE